VAVGQTEPLLDAHFVILGAVIGVIGQSVYVRDTLRGVTQPNRVTFLLWAVAPLLAFAVELQSGVGLLSLTTLVVGLGPLAIFVASFVNRSAVWRIGRLDYACGLLSVVGTVTWLVSRHGSVALVALVAADALAAVPTVIKSWKDPTSESAILYVGGFLNAGVALLTIRTLRAATVAFPLYILVIGGLQVALVGGRLGPRLRHQELSGHAP
jgi:hypothetical protein